MGAFNGFPGFDYNEKIWVRLFQANKSPYSQELMELLSMDVDDGVFTKKKKGQTRWSAEIHAFLAYSASAAVYETKWLKKLPLCREMLDTFKDFIASIPSEAANPKEARFLPVANKVADYLEKVLAHCNGSTVDNHIWIAAGLYVLIAFSLQNSELEEIRFYCPPPEYDPIGPESATVIIPSVEMHSPEAAAATAQAQTPQEEPVVDTQEAEGGLRTCCRLCGAAEQFFYDDRLDSWQEKADSFRVLCKLLSTVFAIGFFCMIIIIAVPTFGNWVTAVLAQTVPKFYSGFADGKDCLLSLASICMCAILATGWMATAINRRVRFITLLEQERGYRWLRYECKACGTSYQEKVRLDQLPDASDAVPPLLRASMAWVLLVIWISVCFVGPLVMALGSSAYELRLLLVLLLPLCICRSIISHRLLRYLTRDYPSFISASCDALFDESPDEDEA